MIKAKPRISRDKRIREWTLKQKITDLNLTSQESIMRKSGIVCISALLPLYNMDHFTGPTYTVAVRAELCMWSGLWKENSKSYNWMYREGFKSFLIFPKNCKMADEPSWWAWQFCLWGLPANFKHKKPKSSLPPSSMHTGTTGKQHRPLFSSCWDSHLSPSIKCDLCLHSSWNRSTHPWVLPSGSLQEFTFSEAQRWIIHGI